MNNFIEAYLLNPSEAIAEARMNSYKKFWFDEYSEDKIYAELGTPEFRLYEEMIFCEEDDMPHAANFAVA